MIYFYKANHPWSLSSTIGKNIMVIMILTHLMLLVKQVRAILHKLRDLYDHENAYYHTASK